MNTKMSHQICPAEFKESLNSSIITMYNNSQKEKKKLTLTIELLEDIIQLKNLTVSENTNHKISFLDPVKCETVKLDYSDTKDTKQLLQESIRTLQDVIFQERSYRQEYIINLNKHLNELHQLDHDMNKKIKNLEQMCAKKELTIEKLRTDIKNVNNLFENHRTHFYKFYMEEFEPSVMLESIEKFKLICDDASKVLPDNIRNTDMFKTVVGSLCSDMQALATDIKCIEFPYINHIQFKTEMIKMFTKQLKDFCWEKLARVNHDNIVAIIDHMDEDCPQTCNFLGLWYAINSVCKINEILENTTNVLDNQVETLQINLSDVTTEYKTLNASISDKKCKADVLDNFCAVTEEITAQQLRNLEFSQILAVDKVQIAEELNKIEQLKTKIVGKKNKKQKLLNEMDSIKSQLEMYKKQYEDLESRKAFLTDDLICVKRSPSKLANQSPLQGVAQRVKHLKQLKIQYNKLTNRRDALKLKLQKHQPVVKTPSRINQYNIP